MKYVGMPAVRPVLALSAVLLVLSGCGSDATVTPEPKSARVAPADARLSFEAVSNALGSVPCSPNERDRTCLGIRQSALGKEFLMYASVAAQAGAATSHGLQGRIVRFEKRGSSVFIIESNAGQVVTRDLPAALILAELPVLRESGNVVTVDFNSGMNRVFTAGAWYGSDMSGTDFSGGRRAMSVPVGLSYVDSIVVSRESVELRQIVNVELTGFGMVLQHAVPTHEVRYVLAPYRSNPAYVGKETSDFERVGYFEVPPVIEEESGRSTVRISKWDASKPVTFHVSANTPPELAEAVREGILYWNKALGAGKVRAEMAPAGVTAPDLRYNLVQWVPWDDAGFAYADALMDPRSGEILQAQIYLTSAFSFGSKTRMREILRRVRGSARRAATRARAHPLEALADPSEGGVSPGFLASGSMCDFRAHADTAYVGALEALSAENVDDDAILRVTRDYVRMVTAHEVGHTMGLRHNFAGTVGATGGIKETMAAFERYVADGTVPSLGALTVTTSVMDYHVFHEAVLIGAQMMREDGAMAYDRAAIAWGYEGAPVGTSTPLFCTDSHVGSYGDCNRFDSGPGPIAYGMDRAELMLQVLPIGFVEHYISRRAPLDPRDAKPLDQVAPPSAAEAASAIAGPAGTSMAWLRDGMSALKIERQYPFIVPGVMAENVKEETQRWVSDQVTRAGGVDQALFRLLPATDRPSWSAKRQALATLDAYLAREDVRRGRGADGEGYELTAADVQTIRDAADLFFTRFEEKLVEELLDQVLGGEFTVPGVLHDLEARLPAVAEAVVMTRSGRTGPRICTTSRTASATDRTCYDLRAYRFPKEVRKQGGKLLGSGVGDLPGWSEDARTALKDKVKSEIASALGYESYDKIKESELPRVARTWLVEQREVLNAI